ncbi:hypothetical protein K2173_026550 [Erythroxylum novogranatense]|uniref:Uncharacterized protein n=1 Tax=Erythroxylum novogranatense TaxID=1862640 RepID=A0AAV8TWW0_9ROSI|nr:hypothetical protein K2173_026550 [Erythroxylum novogranatense]
MGRAPCCDKANVKKGPWSPEEDAKLKSYIEQHGTGGNWIALPQKIGLKRCGKSCRLRWLNYLRPNLKHGGFSEEEDNIICSLYISIGSRWSIIAAQLPGRTDNDIKNYWNTRLKKKLLGKQRKELQARRSSGLKQEMGRGKDNPVASSVDNNIVNVNPCWPELHVLTPIPYSNQEPRLNDHTSIRKLLIKLGGKFCADPQYQLIQPTTNSLQYPIDISHSQQLYDHQLISISPSTSVEALNVDSGSHIVQYGVDEAGLPTLEGRSNFPEGFEGIDYSNSQRLDGLEFLLSDDMGNYRTGTSNPGEAIIDSFGDVSSQIYPIPPVTLTNSEGIPPRFLQEFPSPDLRYPGLV